MYLYEKRENEICIYELVSDDEKLRKFREDELKKQENIFWLATVQDQFFAKAAKGNGKTLEGNHLFENISSGECINVKKLNDKIFYHQFEENKFDDELFNAYCIGQYDFNPTVKVIEEVYGYSPEDQKLYDDYLVELENHRNKDMSPEKIMELRKIWGKKYLDHLPEGPIHPDVKEIVISTNILQYLVPIETNYFKNENDSYNNNYFGCFIRYHMNVISIPKSLYLLNMFLQGNIDEIAEENIDTQLKFFSLTPKPILTVSLEYLEKLIQYNLVRYTDNMDALFDSHQKILKKLK